MVNGNILTGDPDLAQSVLPDFSGEGWSGLGGAFGGGGSASGSGGGWLGVLTGIGGMLGGAGSGSGSGGSGLGGAASGAAAGAMFGPWGAAVGGVLGGLTSLFGNIGQEGWSISCMGNQAYKNTDLDVDLSNLEAEKNKVNGSNLQQVQTFFNWCSANIGLSDKAISNYRSTCSKTLRGKFKTALQAAIDAIKPAYEFTTKSAIGQNQYEGPFNWTEYTITGTKSEGAGSGSESGAGSGTVFIPGIGLVPIGTGGENTPGASELQTAYNALPLTDQNALRLFGQQNNLSFEQVVSAFFSGQISIKDGVVVWGVSAGNQPKNGLLDLALIGAGVFVLFKILKK